MKEKFAVFAISYSDQAMDGKFIRGNTNNKILLYKIIIIATVFSTKLIKPKLSGKFQC
jgi:hypothetical protein